MPLEFTPLLQTNHNYLTYVAIVQMLVRACMSTIRCKANHCLIHEKHVIMH